MIIILPTDTCYGLAGDISSPEDYYGLYRLKGRDFDKKLAFLVEDWDMLRQYSDITDAHIKTLKEYIYPWSIILNRKDTLILPEYLDQEQYTSISFRVASNCIPAYIRNRIKYPLFLTSANLSGSSESTTLSQTQAYFPGIQAYDGGICDHLPSDIFSIANTGELQYIRRNY